MAAGQHERGKPVRSDSRSARRQTLRELPRVSSADQDKLQSPPSSAQPPLAAPAPRPSRCPASQEGGGVAARQLAPQVGGWAGKVLQIAQQPVCFHVACAACRMLPQQQEGSATW